MVYQSKSSLPYIAFPDHTCFTLFSIRIYRSIKSNRRGNSGMAHRKSISGVFASAGFRRIRSFPQLLKIHSTLCMTKPFFRLHTKQDHIHTGACFILIGKCSPLKQSFLIFFSGSNNRCPGRPKILRPPYQPVPVVKFRQVTIFESHISFLAI